MKRSVRYTVFIIVLLLCAGAFNVPAFAAGSAAVQKLREPDGGIIGISNRGMWTKYPENSKEAIAAAHEAGLDLVLTDVSLTKDGVPVLLEAHSAKRMLDAEKEDVSVYTLQELQSLKLKDRLGGAANGVTGYSVCTLKDALNYCMRNGIGLVLKFDVSAVNEVKKTVDEANAADFCALYITGKAGKVKSAVNALGKNYAVIAEKRSNVIFSVKSFIKQMQNDGAAGAVLKTTNRYGVIFYKSTLAGCDSMRAISDTSAYETAGWREDCAKWWDDLVTRGYSAVITDDPTGFAAYLNANAAARERLGELYGFIESRTLPDFGSGIISDYEKNFRDAKTKAKALLDDASSSTAEMQDAYAALTAAYKAIELNHEEIQNGTAGRTGTLPRILLCVGAVLAVVAVQVYFYKKRKPAPAEAQNTPEKKEER